MASPSENEYFGNLSLKRSERSKTGYWGVYGPNDKCTEKPYQAFIKNKRTSKQQAVGSFATAKEAAIYLAKMLALEEDDDLESPRKQAKRGALIARPCVSVMHRALVCLSNADMFCSHRRRQCQG